ncbi:MAG: hypothetical protein WC797_00760 [Candidatus Paceibacterota bacterium]
MKGIPDADIDKFVKIFTENPDLFKKIAEEAQMLMKSQGLDQMTAITNVAGKYQAELKGVAEKFK